MGVVEVILLIVGVFFVLAAIGANIKPKEDA